MTTITMIDYGGSNIRSVQKAFEHVGAQTHISANPDDILNADKLVMPGVGAFSSGMAAMRERGLDTAVIHATQQGVPLLGICLGMQFLFDESDEMGRHKGLGLIPGKVTRFNEQSTINNQQPTENTEPFTIHHSPSTIHHSPSTIHHLPFTIHHSPFTIHHLKVPHMGWNQLEHDETHPLLAGVPSGSYAYFVHSYYCVPANRIEQIGATDYGLRFTCMVGRNNVYGLQFHPEKSQHTGLQIIKNYVEL